MDVSPEMTAEAALGLYFGQLAGPNTEVAVDEDESLPEESGPIDRPLVERWIRGVFENRQELDQMLAGASKNWRVERMALVDRNVIRLAFFELKFCPEVPVAVAINEAVELGKQFGGADAGAFVNGLLDRAVTELGLRR
jgi:N utilization substance protein B